MAIEPKKEMGRWSKGLMAKKNVEKVPKEGKKMEKKVSFGLVAILLALFLFGSLAPVALAKQHDVYYCKANAGKWSGSDSRAQLFGRCAGGEMVVDSGIKFGIRMLVLEGGNIYRPFWVNDYNLDGAEKSFKVTFEVTFTGEACARQTGGKMRIKERIFPPETFAVRYFDGGHNRSLKGDTFILVGWVPEGTELDLLALSTGTSTEQENWYTASISQDSYFVKEAICD